VRSAIADAEHDAIFVSIHYNASPRSSAHGIETYSESNRGAVLAARIQQEIIDRVSTRTVGSARPNLRASQVPVCRQFSLNAGFLPIPNGSSIGPDNCLSGANWRNRSLPESLEQRQFAFPSLAPIIEVALSAQKQEATKNR